MIPCRPQRAGSGFTLFEVLVALAIISVALLAAMRAAGLGTSNVSELRNHMLASWVAQNLLAEQQSRGDWPSTGILDGKVTQAGVEFSWREEVIGTPNAAFRRVDIFVFEGEDRSRSLARLTGFLVNPPTNVAR